MTGHVTSGWLSRLRTGMSRSSKNISDGVAKIFTNHRLAAQLDNESIIAYAPLSTAQLSGLQLS